jgi:isoquinoline 1-oxidoreductase subunit beta
MSEQPSTSKKKLITRRDFLITLGVGAAGVYLGVRLGTPVLRLKLASMMDDPSSSMPMSIEGTPDAWFEITPDNRVRLYLPKSEMGQGIHTALAQIAAEELDLEWTQLEVTHAPTGRLDDPMGTAASNSVSSLYLPLRETAATLRQLLITEAARQMGVGPGELTAVSGRVSLQNDPGSGMTYGELFQHASEWELPKKPPALKPTGDFKHIGQPTARLDLPSKITGEAVFGYDVRLPRMLYGAVARPRTVAGRLLSVDPGEGRDMPGVVKIIIEEGFAGVVAESRQQAHQALAALATQWDDGKLWQQEEIEALVTVGRHEGITIQKEGRAADTLAAGQPLKAEYRTPMAYHAYMEPMAAAADVTPEAVQVWASTQAAVGARNAVAEALGRKKDTVVVTPVYLGGGFGRKIDETIAVDAARLSQAVGRPVHVGLYRDQDFRNGFLRPPTHHRLRAVQSSSGDLLAFEHRQSSGEVAFPFVPAFLKTLMGADFGSYRGAMSPYNIPDRLVIAELAELAIPTGWWRGLGLFANIFALESFMDEMAHAAGADPLAYRLRHLDDDELGVRLRNVLQAAADKAGWDVPLPEGHGRGIACCLDAGTVAAEVVEVLVEGGKINVQRVTAAIDPGLIINPDGVEAQTQGSITMGLSAALLEEVIIKDGVLQATNFRQYPLLRGADAPDIEVVQLQSSDTPSGMGEPPIGPIAAALANAIYAASGQRLRRLPLKLSSEV